MRTNRTTPTSVPAKARSTRPAAPRALESDRGPTAWKPAARATTVRAKTAVALAPGVVQRPAIEWAGGLQHNGNNPEIIDKLGRSYSSRGFKPEGVSFADAKGQFAPQQIFSSNKNMSGRPVGQSVVLTNPGATPLRLKVNLAITDPTGKPPVQLELTLAPGASRRVPVVQSQRDGGFTAFTALVTPLDAASRAGKLHVDVVAHEPGTRQDAAGLAKGTLMKTEGERGYRVPPSRLSEHPHYEKELRFVMKAAGVTPDPVADAHWTSARVTDWARQQGALGSAGAPNAFDTSVNRGIQGRVNALVSATEGRLSAEPLQLSRPDASATVRVLSNRAPPPLVAGRMGAAARDAGAYGKRFVTTLPLVNTSSSPITVTVQLKTPPPGQDGSQLPGHQVYNGPVGISATGGQLHDVASKATLGQPAPATPFPTSANVATVVVPANTTVPLRVALETHANSQFPVDVVVTRR